jgi:enolase
LLNHNGVFCFAYHLLIYSACQLLKAVRYSVYMSKIASIHARQILDSRGNPTVEVDITLEDGSLGRASVPSGASTGTHEALELRDNNPKEYLGKGVEKAIGHVNNEIAEFLKNNNPFDQITIDNEMILRDATQNAGKYGANAILGVSLAMSKAAATSLNVPYYVYIRQLYSQLKSPESIATIESSSFAMPRPMFNVLNGGAHTDWQTTDIQEYMIIPMTDEPFAEQLRNCAEIYHHLGKILKAKGYSTMVGDEGGFAPKLRNDEEALEIILRAIDAAGYKAGKEICIGIDAAMSALWSDKRYKLRVQKKEFTQDELIQMWKDWVRQYPICSLEDGLAEDDWDSWTILNKELGNKVQIVGDDLLVTNLERIKKAISLQSCNSLLMKVNQIGTLTESIQAIIAAQNAGWKVVVSHRSGETEDASIADIVVGTSAGQIKAGAPSRSERLAKYNQLLRIEEQLNNIKSQPKKMNYAAHY